MEISLLIRSLIAGFLIALPTGPIGFFVGERAISQGIRAGIGAALGSFIGDIIYTIVILFGPSHFSNVLLGHNRILQLVGGTLLLVVGIDALFNTSKVKKHTTLVQDMGTMFTAFFMTITNPIPLVTFSAIFGAAGFVGLSMHGTIFVLMGFVIGALVWWVLFMLLLSYFRKRAGSGGMQVVRKVAGVIFTIGGVLILMHVAW